jgi:hypothetical protein
LARMVAAMSCSRWSVSETMTASRESIAAAALGHGAGLSGAHAGGRSAVVRCEGVDAVRVRRGWRAGRRTPAGGGLEVPEGAVAVGLFVSSDTPGKM